jgi:hypothetical protein
MTRHLRLIAFVGVALAATSTGCRQQEVRPEELFQAQSLGLSDLETGRLPEAEAQFTQVIALAPQEALGYANLGVTYLRAARYSDAEAQLRRARELDPASVDIGLMVAKLSASTGRTSEARATLEQLRRAAPRNSHVLYALAELDVPHGVGDSSAHSRYENELREILAAAPTNLAVRLKLIDAFVRRGMADSGVRQLEEVRRVGPEIPAEARSQLAQVIAFLRGGQLAAARSPLDRFLHLMELTSTYQASLDDVKWLQGPLVGRPVLTFTPKSLVTLRMSGRGKTGTDMVRFVDATTDAGLPEVHPSMAASETGAIAIGDYDGDGTDDLFISFPSAAPNERRARLYHVQGGQLVDVTERAGISIPAGAIDATFVDFDNDGHLDLFVIGADQRPYLLRNTGAGRFEDVTAKSGITTVGGARKALFVDLDHDGDLDLLLIGGPSVLVYRNNLDGTFTDVSQTIGLRAADGAPTRDAAFADFDGDGRIDLVVAREKGNASLYRNAGNRQFIDGIAASGIRVNGGTTVASGDYNNDGFFDILVAGAGGPPSLWLNDGSGVFRRDSRSSEAFTALGSLSVLDAKFVDYDNDGWLDLVVAGKPTTAGGRGVFLFHNDGTGKFVDRSSILPVLGEASSIVPDDVDSDGDQDLFVATPGGVRLLRNDGGNSNLSMQVQLVGLRTGSGKNNDFGIGAKVEVRAAELYQTRVVTSRVTSFGLGPHLKADVVRIEWPNGVPQTVFFPGSDQDVIENEVLKGSCAFLYTWDGHGFQFMTDVMWRSALGMPLGILGSNTAYAPAAASQEYLRIPGSALQPRDGRYVLQLTEELWETAYADHVRLVAVDHPDSVNVFVDERFVPPGPVQLRLFQVGRQQPPVSAVDDRGNDVLPALREKDNVYISNLTPLQYQGVVEPHDLIMDLGPDAGRDSTFLFLRGWIYPTDASINIALSQQSTLKTMMPSLEVRDGRGQWRTAIANIGFPSGKDKTIVVDLSGKFPTNDHHVRIRTNLQIYWDQAFTGRDAPSNAVHMTSLNALSADLHFRGYSRTYRKGGRYGPWWFDYDSVTSESPWRPIQGSFTRFGDVLPLLKRSDDMYVIMAPGDEVTLQFDAASAAQLPAGWTRDFLLYTDGWIKDSDLNTAFGTTVGPLPFHAIREYPYAAGDSYPADSVHARYLREYNTRTAARRR